MTKYYGKVGTNQTRMALPFPMYLAWGKKQKIDKITIHEKCHDSCLRVFMKIKDHYSPEEIAANGYHWFGGSLNVRKMRGGNRWSMHAWGTAIDFDPARNQLKWNKDEAHLARPESEAFWTFWEEEGWTSLGRARDFDWMHVQAADL